MEMRRHTTYRAIGWLAVAGLVAGALVGPTAGMASAANVGSIWTSTSDGTIVNANHYANKTDVYLNGGPQNCNGSGLVDGLYYFQVTDPSGATLLSSDAISAREVQVTNGVIAGKGGTGTHVNGSVGPCGAIAVQLAPYDDTPNNGDTYKVLVGLAADVATCTGFSASSTTFNFDSCNIGTKSDTFHVGALITPTPTPTPTP
ncbi:MAG TPA: hypothetical protein VE640_03440, partial [Candidatus Bathyarchaeia archaeon]|nr:hypothetical protein [Candidatus Bathyarchaeia archaeon]